MALESGFRSLYHIGIYVIASLTFLPLAQAESTASFSKNTTEPYMDERRNKYSQVQSEVENNLEDWIDNPYHGTWRTGNSNADELFEKDYDWLVDEQIESCNRSDTLQRTHNHTHDDLHDGYETESENCQIDFKYNGNGYIAGRCLLIISLPPFCKVFKIFSDLVDYVYPTKKESISFEAFYSRYNDQEAVTNGDMGNSNSSDTASIHTLPTKLENAKGHIRNSINAFNSFRGIPAYTGMIPNVQVATSPQYAWLKGSARSFGRIWGEEEIEDEYETYFPHTDLEQEPYASEIDAWALSYFLSESEDVDSTLYRRHGRRPETCTRHNMATGRTPDFPRDIKASWTARTASGSSSKNINRMQCLTDIGPVVPFTADRMPSITDSFFQGLVRTLKAYYSHQGGGSFLGGSLGGKGSFTFRRDVDRLSFIPEKMSPDNNQLNDEFRYEIGNLNHKPDTNKYNCTLLEDATFPNYKFDELNIVDIKSRGETTVEIFTNFSGCWVTKSLPIRWRTRPSMFGFTEIRLR